MMVVSDCQQNLWFNDICDDKCNNATCNYDFNDCDIEYNPNATCDVNNLCYTEWVGDGWCDVSCVTNIMQVMNVIMMMVIVMDVQMNV